MPEVVIGIITYRRPEGLRRLLDSLVPEVSRAEVKVIVVDNDARRSAEATCRPYRDVLHLEYDVEERRGVSHPRNRVLRLGQQAKSIIFLDDDEWVEPGWYDNLTAVSQRFPDSIITGPVRYILPDDRRSWAVDAGHFETANHLHESVIPATGAGNTLIPNTALHRLAASNFDVAYSRCGGEDHELFQRMRRAGCEIRWAAHARVQEEVPLERATAQWIRQRSTRSGYIRGMMMLTDRSSRIDVISHGLARVFLGVASYIFSLRRFKRKQRSRARASAMVLSGIGFLAAAVRRPIEAYGLGHGDEL